MLSLTQIQQEIGYADAQALRQPIPRARPQHPHSLAQSAARSSASHPQCSGVRSAGLLQAWLPCNTCRTQSGKVVLKAAKGRTARGKRQEQKASIKRRKAKAKGRQRRAQGNSKASSVRQKGSTEGAHQMAILSSKTALQVVQCIVYACKTSSLV